MFTAKTIEEMQFIEDINSEYPYWNFSPAFIITYYKVFELLGYKDTKEEVLCKVQLNIVKSLISRAEYRYAELEAEKAAKAAVRKYSHGNNHLELPNLVIA